MSADTTVVVCPHCDRKNRVPARAAGKPRCGHCHQPLPWIAEADDGSFATVVEQSEVPVLVDLWASWCGPCHMVSPILEHLAGELADRVKLVKVDVDKSPQTAQRFAVQSIPTLLLLRGGEVVARQTGAAALPALRAWLTQGLEA